MIYFNFLDDFKGLITNKELSDLTRSLANLEKSIIHRQGHYIKLDIRFIHDITKFLFRKYLSELSTEEKKEMWIIDLIYLHYKKFSLKKLADTLNPEFWITDYDKDNIIRLYKEGNDEVHYQEGASFEEVMGHSHEKVYKSRDMIGIAMAIYFIYKWFAITAFDLEIEDKGNDIPIEFSDGTKSFDILPEKENFLNLIGLVCPLCEEGNIIMPEVKTFPFGPYLRCNNKKCGANVSTSFRARRATVIYCANEGCVDKNGNKTFYKETYDFKKSIKYNKCIKCGLIDSSDDLEEYEINFWETIID